MGFLVFIMEEIRGFMLPVEWAVERFMEDPGSLSGYTMYAVMLGVALGLAKSFVNDGAVFGSLTPGQAGALLSFIGEGGFMTPVMRIGRVSDLELEALVASGMIAEVGKPPIRAYVVTPAWYTRIKRHRWKLGRMAKKREKGKPYQEA